MMSFDWKTAIPRSASRHLGSTLGTVVSIRKLLIIASLVALPQGQPADAQSLVAFTGKDANFDDEFAFVALQAIPNGTVFFVTNYDFDNTLGTFPTTTTEGTLQFTASAEIPKGTVVHVVETSADTYTVTGDGGAIHVSGSWSAVSADPHYAFTASNPASPLDSVTEVYAYMDTDPDNAGGGVKDPRIGVGMSPNAVVLDFIGVQPVGADFVGDRSMAVLADLTNPANFTTTIGPADLSLDLTPFTASGLPVDLYEFSID